MNQEQAVTQAEHPRWATLDSTVDAATAQQQIRLAIMGKTLREWSAANLARHPQTGELLTVEYFAERFRNFTYELFSDAEHVISNMRWMLKRLTPEVLAARGLNTLRTDFSILPPVCVPSMAYTSEDATVQLLREYLRVQIVLARAEKLHAEWESVARFVNDLCSTSIDRAELEDRVNAWLEADALDGQDGMQFVERLQVCGITVDDLVSCLMAREVQI